MTKHTPAPEKQGIVMHSCPLARNGLLHFLCEQLPDFTFQAAASFNEMGRLPGLTQAELVVSDISDGEKSAAAGADWLMWLQHTRGNRPLVIVAEELPKQQLLDLSRHPLISLLALQTQEALLNQQLQQVLAAKQVISRFFAAMSTTSSLQGNLPWLTGAELQVFELLHAGYSVTQIASKLCRSVKTVSTHKRHLMSKMRVDNEISLFARVKNLNEKVGCLDNGQQFVKHLRQRAS